MALIYDCNGSTTNLNEALAHARCAPADRRAIIATVTSTDVSWWGGLIDDWQPDESRLSSSAALNGYRHLLAQFRHGELSTAHVVMAYSDGTFDSVMLGVSSRKQVDVHLRETTELMRKRSMSGWVRA